MALFTWLAVQQQRHVHGRRSESWSVFLQHSGAAAACHSGSEVGQRQLRQLLARVCCSSAQVQPRRVALCTTSSAQASQTNKLCSNSSSERGRGKCFAAAAKLRVRTARALQGSGQKWRRSESSHFCSFCNDTNKSRSHTVSNANPNLHLLNFLRKHIFDQLPLCITYQS